MPNTTTLRATGILLGLLAALVLTACGGSSKSAGTSATTSGVATAPSATTPTGTTGTSTTKSKPSPAATAYRKCLEAHGAGLPRLVPGPGGSVALGRLEPPKGVSRATYDAAVKACGGSGASAVSKNVTRFVECMRDHGVNVPAPDEGKSLLSYLSDIKNPQFKPALEKCAGLLRQASGSSG